MKRQNFFVKNHRAAWLCALALTLLSGVVHAGTFSVVSTTAHDLSGIDGTWNWGDVNTSTNFGSLQQTYEATDTSGSFDALAHFTFHLKYVPALHEVVSSGGFDATVHIKRHYAPWVVNYPYFVDLLAETNDDADSAYITMLGSCSANDIDPVVALTSGRHGSSGHQYSSESSFNDEDLLTVHFSSGSGGFYGDAEGVAQIQYIWGIELIGDTAHVHMEGSAEGTVWVSQINSQYF